MTNNSLIAVIGLIAFLGFTISNVEVNKIIKEGNINASARDKEDIEIINVGPVNGQTGEEIPICDKPLDEVVIKYRIMSENDSQSIVAILSNKSNKACAVFLRILAPNFTVSPLIQDTQLPSMFLNPGEVSHQIWILTPEKTGTFDISISANNSGKIIGLTVKNLLGLSPTQTQVLSYIGSAFGPMLTIPWWMEKLQIKNRKKTKKQKR